MLEAKTLQAIKKKHACEEMCWICRDLYWCERYALLDRVSEVDEYHKQVTEERLTKYALNNLKGINYVTPTHDGKQGNSNGTYNNL